MRDDPHGDEGGSGEGGYERGFYVLYEKRPSSGRFRKPVFDSKTGRYKISYADLVCLTEGLTRTEIHMPERSSEDFPE